MVGIRARRARLGLMAKTDAVLKNLPVSAFIRDNYLVLLIFVAGLALRIYAIGSESIWYDEAISVAVAKLGFVEHLRWITEVDDNNPPLYYTFLHLWISVFGDSEVSVRMPSAIFGSLSIPGEAPFR
jgi:mannosyltransferase